MIESMLEEFKKGYRKGYEDGLKDGLEEALSQVARGYKPQELRLVLRSRMTTIDEKVRSRLERLEEMKIQPEPEEEGPTEIREGSSCIVKESRFERSLDVFLNLVEGRKGICITRINPKSIKAILDRPDMQVFWLTSAEKRGEKEYGFISPTDLVTLASTILSFISENENSVVLLQGVEYLISQNNFNVILKMIQKVNDSVVLRQSIFLVSLNPSGMDKREYSNLLKEMTQEI